LGNLEISKFIETFGKKIKISWEILKISKFIETFGKQSKFIETFGNIKVH